MNLGHHDCALGIYNKQTNVSGAGDKNRHVGQLYPEEEQRRRGHRLGQSPHQRLEKTAGYFLLLTSTISDMSSELTPD